jgi:hypothetical protein
VIWPFQSVPIQLTNLMPVGMAMRKVISEKESRTAPVANVWWAHTTTDRAVVEMVAKTMPL